MMRSRLRIFSARRWVYPVTGSSLLVLGFWLGHTHTDAPLAAQQVQQASNTAAAPAAQTDSKRAIAFILDKDSNTNIPITREEFGEYFISLFGPDQVETYVNRRIIEMNCAKRGIEVTWQEVDAQIDEDCKRVSINRADFVKTVLKQRYGKTLAEWRLDVIRPRLMMAKYCRDRIQVTDEDLRKIFENRYGKKVRCKIIIWPADFSQGKEESAASVQREALRAYKDLTKSDADFDRVATKQKDSVLAAQAGEIEPIGRFSGVENDQIEKLAFELQEGQVSPVKALPGLGWIVIKCIGHVPPAVGVSFEKEKPILAKEVIERKLEKEIPKVVQEMQIAASATLFLRPRRQWTPEEIERATGVSPRNAATLATPVGKDKK